MVSTTCSGAPHGVGTHGYRVSWETRVHLRRLTAGSRPNVGSYARLHACRRRQLHPRRPWNNGRGLWRHCRLGHAGYRRPRMSGPSSIRRCSFLHTHDTGARTGTTNRLPRGHCRTRHTCTTDACGDRPSMRPTDHAVAVGRRTVPSASAYLTRSATRPPQCRGSWQGGWSACASHRNVDWLSGRSVWILPQFFVCNGRTRRAFRARSVQGSEPGEAAVEGARVIHARWDPSTPVGDGSQATYSHIDTHNGCRALWDHVRLGSHQFHREHRQEPSAPASDRSVEYPGPAELKQPV